MIQQAILPQDTTSGYAHRLGLLKDLPIPLPLSEGINILFGPNGCGKSTLLKMMAEYTTCPHSGREFRSPFEIKIKDNKIRIVEVDSLQEHIPGGWYRPNILGIGHSFRKEIELDGKKVLPVYLPGIRGALDLQWDGCPVYFRDFTIFKGRDMLDGVTIHNLKTGEKREPIISSQFKGQSVGDYRDARSRGESTITLFTELETALADVPNATLLGYDDGTGKENLPLKLWKEYILSRGPAQGYTFLLDEPDTHLSIPAQRQVWEKLIRFSQQHQAQMIVASHSPLPLFYPQMNIIEFQKGYAQECKDALVEMVKA